MSLTGNALKVPPLRLAEMCIADDFVRERVLPLSKDNVMTRRIRQVLAGSARCEWSIISKLM